MATLETRTAKINVIISLKGYDDARISCILSQLKTYCESHSDIYAMILHDKDVLESGEIKTKHIHLVAILKNNRRRLSSTLDEIATYCQLNTLAVSIDKMSDLVGSLQYLIHKHNPEKHQYDIKNIVTNIGSGELHTYMASDSKSMSIEYLIDVICLHKNKIDIMRTIGLQYYHLYRNVIIDIYREIWE